MTHLEVPRGDYCSCRMLLCWLNSSNALLKLSSICSECSTRRLEPGSAAVKSGQHWGLPFPRQGQSLEPLQGSACGPWTGALIFAGNILGSVCEALQRGRQSSGCARQEGQLEQPRSFTSPSPHAGSCSGICLKVMWSLSPSIPHQGQGVHTPKSEQEGATGLLQLEICSSGMSKASSPDTIDHKAI